MRRTMLFLAGLVIGMSCTLAVALHGQGACYTLVPADTLHRITADMETARATMDTALVITKALVGSARESLDAVRRCDAQVAQELNLLRQELVRLRADQKPEHGFWSDVERWGPWIIATGALVALAVHHHKMVEQITIIEQPKPEDRRIP